MGVSVAIFLAVSCVLSCIVGGGLAWYFKNGYVGVPLGLIAPTVVQIFYCLSLRDEFPIWAVIMTLGLCASFMGSVAGVAYVKILAYQNGSRKTAT